MSAETAIDSAAPGIAVSSPTVSERREPFRRRLPDEREAIVHHFNVAGHEGYLTVGLYEDGQPGEIFIRMAKAGSTIAGLMDSFGIAVSMALQYGVALKVLCDKFSHTRFEPSGWTGNPKIGYAKSLMDYIFRWLALKFVTADSPGVSIEAPDKEQESIRISAAQAPPPLTVNTDAPACKDCGAIMTLSGSCYRCDNCGSTSGCS